MEAIYASGSRVFAIDACHMAYCRGDLKLGILEGEFLPLGLVVSKQRQRCGGNGQSCEQTLAQLDSFRRLD